MSKLIDFHTILFAVYRTTFNDNIFRINSSEFRVSCSKDRYHDVDKTFEQICKINTSASLETPKAAAVTTFIASLFHLSREMTFS
mmetsp:Transcript_37563/g.44801  ORF Transcript_37563/g.44801 Transcript_37563/m.44801 type:complete len:85 (-) Transcript_37563:206-460(-)